MTTSNPEKLYVWVWLAGAVDPVVAGVIEEWDTQVVFAYASSYRNRQDAVSLYAPELPLRQGPIRPNRGLSAPGVIRDAAPDAWGQRVILYRLTGMRGRDADTAELGLLTYLIESGSNRVGALDFQTSPSQYVPRDSGGSLEEMVDAVSRLEEGESISEDVLAALQGGTSVGGARPKVTLREEGREMIAKISATTDTYPVVKAEAAAMYLARQVGLDVPDTELIETLGRDVLVVDRFDRVGMPTTRRMVVSGLTILGLDEFTSARYASYPALAHAVRQRFKDPKQNLRELFSRMVFNICIGNTDDHARNHSAFWDGKALTLTPAYDICPQLRTGREASQAMALDPNGFRLSRLRACIERSRYYLLTEREASEIVEHQVDVIHSEWQDAAEQAHLTSAEQELLWGTAILNPYATEDL